MKYIDGVFGDLAEKSFDLQFFIEVKSNLTKKQIKTLAHHPDPQNDSLNLRLPLTGGLYY